MIADVFRRWKHARRIVRAKAEIAGRDPRPGAPHWLDAPLIVSLTSYGARLAAAELVLASLLRQTVRADRVILWLDEEDLDRLPGGIRDSGAEIRVCPNWKSYKKLVPTLLESPEAYIVTADDDLYYGPDWLEGLVAAAKAGAKVACHRGHRVTLEQGLPQKYDNWQRNIPRPDAGKLIFPTGVGGVLYGPGVFHPDATDAGKFMRLAPSADDVWFYWMHRLRGSEPEKIGGNFRVIEWPDSQTQNLRATNLGTGGNDRAIQAMIDAYGWPG
ncbi:glycosyltransferase [Paracoccus sediminicola]|uniref:glycosyltransferase n=1 Tax=Paracoccus sediminicola TaxID=3017783 RepID=UPI0022F0369A|nr:glycosyltransferase [Paracoccus sediminicola]WBU55569.1 glycosyltransferase family 2 protein [Paracoccus sediminicola]